MSNKIFTLFISLILFSCSTSSTLVQVPANESVELDYPNIERYEATIKNKSLKGLGVAVLNKETEEQVSGFGLGIKGTAEVTVDNGNKLVLKNDSNKAIKLAVKISPKAIGETRTPATALPKDKTKYISFTLQNTTAKSIPLIIPTVMNPNLSPFSKSGVDLKIGQEIIFKEKGKKYVLLVVDETIKQDGIINVAKVLKERKLELGLAK